MRLYAEIILLPADCESANVGFNLYDEEQSHGIRPDTISDASDFVVDIREYDVPYHVRVAIDKGSAVEILRLTAGED